jgi:LPXTG-motif cell wall-anchored protein
MKVAGPVNDTIPAGQTKTETLTWDTTGFSAGSNTIVAVLSTAGGLNGPSSQANGKSVALAAAPPPLTGSQIAIIGGIIAAIAVVVLALVLLRRRKPPQTL